MLILLEDIGEGVGVASLVEDVPVVPHEVGEWFLKLGVDDYLLELSDDLVEEGVFGGVGVVWVGADVL